MTKGNLVFGDKFVLLMLETALLIIDKNESSNVNCFSEDNIRLLNVSDQHCNYFIMIV